ncbi:MAG: hypothetical protein HDR80_05030 [Bacteroides sp.]|nr:hypothetical protein [Bacteroides sp.]
MTTKRTYAISGYVEYMARIPAGPREIDIHFTGGQMSGFGVRPATFETADPVMCRIIEGSALYKGGRIRRI